MKNHTSLVVIMIFFCFFAIIRAEDVLENTAEGEEQIRKICILEAVNLSKDSRKTDEDQVFKGYFKDNLNLELKNAGYIILDDTLWKKKQTALGYKDVDLIEGPKAVEVAAAAGADVVIIQFYYIDNNRITFGIKCYDVKTKILIVQSIKEGRAGLSISSTINEILAEIIPTLSREITPVATVGKDIEKEKIVEEIIQIPVYEEKGRTVTVVLKSPDNEAELYLADEKIGSIKEEKFSLETQANSQLLLDIKKEGFHTAHKKLVIGETDMEIPLGRLMKITDWGLKVEYSWFQFVGAGFGGRIYFIPDVLGLDMQDYPYFQIPTMANRYVSLHNDTNFTFFLYPFISPSTFYRFNIVAGVGVISSFLFRYNSPPNFDFYIDYGITLAELNFQDFLIYFKVYGRNFFDILHTGILGTRSAPPIGAQFTYGVLFKW